MRGVGAVRGMAIGPAPATVEQHPSPLRQPYQVSVTSFKQKRFRPSKAGSARTPVEAVACPDRRSDVGRFEMTDVRRFDEAFLEPVAVAPPPPPAGPKAMPEEGGPARCRYGGAVHCHD